MTVVIAVLILLALTLTKKCVLKLNIFMVDCVCTDFNHFDYPPSRLAFCCVHLLTACLNL